MSSVCVEFTNPGSELIVIFYNKSRTTHGLSFSVRPDQVHPHNFDANTTYDFKFLRGRTRAAHILFQYDDRLS
ncbi:hypothetical protein PNOK_0957400 [Pyrrhoderma noxium]|uniref:Uncharacterized protein n=1 Tax=Pyrrhoderma noxium TaxID=2282107 RepID=A0A286U5Z8_9AGAM|nr:hypothetical protein PNOK_0957400 [Pyrrhoderma noxium]